MKKIVIKERKGMLYFPRQKSGVDRAALEFIDEGVAEDGEPLVTIRDTWAEPQRNLISSARISLLVDEQDQLLIDPDDERPASEALQQNTDVVTTGIFRIRGQDQDDLNGSTVGQPVRYNSNDQLNDQSLVEVLNDHEFKVRYAGQYSLRYSLYQANSDRLYRTLIGMLYVDSLDIGRYSRAMNAKFYSRQFNINLPIGPTIVDYRYGGLHHCEEIRNLAKGQVISVHAKRGGDSGTVYTLGAFSHLIIQKLS